MTQVHPEELEISEIKTAEIQTDFYDSKAVDLDIESGLSNDSGSNEYHSFSDIRPSNVLNPPPQHSVILSTMSSAHTRSTSISEDKEDNEDKEDSNSGETTPNHQLELFKLLKFTMEFKDPELEIGSIN